MKESLRKSGIDIIGDVPCGTHLCQFYQTKEELVDILVPYLKAGLENNEFCLWISSEPQEAEDSKEVLRKTIPDLDIYLQKGQVAIIPYTCWDLNEDIFDSEKALSELVEKINHALESGYDGLRFGGNLSWMDKEGQNCLVEYKKQIGNVIDNYQAIALCTYSLNKCNPTEIIDVIANHQFSLVKKEGEWKRIEGFGRKNISEHHRTKEVLPKNEKSIKLKLENSLSPAREIADLGLAENIDIREFQSLMEDFYKLTHIPIGLNDKGNVLVNVGWQDICTKFHRVNSETCKHCIESNTKLSAGVPHGEFLLYKCKNNMWDAVTPIIVEGQHVGNIFAGQFFFDDEPLDYELFRSQAKKCGFNEEEYIAALEKVPRLSREAVATGMNFFITLANMLSQISFSNIKQVQSLAERNALVDTLRESDDRFRSVLENSLDSAYRRDLQNNCFDYMSPVIEQITGFSPEEIDAMSINDFFDRIYPDDRLLVVEENAKSLDEGFAAYEYRFKCKDGKYRWLADHFSIIKDKTGMPRFRAGIARDITERKKAEETLRISDNYNRSLIEASLDPLVTIGLSGKIKDVNGATEQVTGYSRNELIGTDFSNYFTEPKRARAGYQQAFTEGKVQDYPLEIQHKEGNITPVLYNASVYRDENGEVIGVFAAARDITEIKKAEKALQVSEARYRSLYENSLDGILLTKPDGTILSANPEACHMFGMTEDEIKRVGREGVVVNDEKLAAALEERKLTGRMRAELTHRRKDGATFVCDTTSQLFINADGSKSTSLIIRDITERKRDEEALSCERSLLESIMQATDFMLVFLDPQFSFVWVNPAYAETCQMKPEEMIGKNHFALYPHAENEAIFRHVRDTGEGVFYKDKPFVFPDQPERGVTYWDWSLAPVKDSGGNVTGLVFSLRETTKHKQAEEALRKSETRLRLAQVSAGAGIWDWDMSTDKLEWSEELFQLFGLDPRKTDANFDSWRGMLHPDDRLIAESRIETAIKNRASLASEYRIVLPSGEVRWINALGSTTYDRGGKPQRMSGICIDITERKLAEEEVHETRSMLQLIMNNIPQGIFWKDRNFRYMGCNTVFAKAAGLEYPENIVGKTDYDLPWALEQTKLFREYDRKIMENDTPEYHIVEQQREAERELVWIETNKVPMRDIKGNVIGILGTYEDITERKKAEEALRFSNLYNRSLIEASLDPLVTIGPDGKITDVNRATEQVTGFSRSELIGTDFSDYFTEPEKASGGYQQVFKDGEVRDYPLKIQHKDGHITPVLYNASVYKDEAGKIIGVFAAARDITELKRAEEEIQTLANAVESSDDAIITKSLDEIINTWNKGAEQVYGYSAEEVLGKTISTIEPENLKGETQRLTKKIKQRERIHHYETLRLKKDGTIINVSITLSPVFDESGKLVAISTIARDITERKKAEETLRLSYLYNRSLIEASLDPLVTIGQDGKITDVNKATELVTGYSRSNLIGTDFIDYFTEPEKAKKGYKEVFREGLVSDYALEIRHRNGRVTPVLYNASVYKDESGKVIGVFAAARNITRIKKAEEALKKAYDNLEDLVNERTVELEKAYDSLKESERSLAEAQKMAHIGNWEWDIATDKAYWSEEMYRIFKRDPQKLAPSLKEYYSYIHPDDLDYYCKVNDYTQKIPASGLDFRIVSANGEEHTLHIKSDFIFDDENNPIKVKGIVQDITERKKTEEKIRTLANAVESSNDAIVTQSLDNIITSWNKAAEQIYGYSAEEIIGKNASMLEPDNIKGEIKYFSEKIKQGKKVQHYETSRLRKDGSIINISVTLSPVFNVSGELVALSAIVRDITERKREEKALRESEARLRRFYESGMFGVIFYNVDGSITDANNKFLEIVGYSREDMQTGKVNWKKMTPPEYRLLDEGAVAELKATGGNVAREKEYIRKDGSRVPIVLGAATLDPESQEGIAFVIDNTERKKAEEALAEMDKMRIKEIHHRIKNNLQVISSLLDLQADKFGDEKVRDAFKESQNRVVSMSLIHEELYKGQGTDKLNFSAYLQKLAENLFQTYSLSNKNIRLLMDLEEDAFFDMDTAVPLGIIVNELVSNSLKHAFTEGEEGEIRIRLCREEKKNGIHESPFSLTISDNGKGISENIELESLESLGLQLVGILVDQLDGEIEVKRAQGAEFKIIFNMVEKL